MPAHPLPPKFLTDESPRMQYRRRKGEVKTTLHWGQRKLLMSEIDFLTRYACDGGKYAVVYAGAAPATHAKYLSSLFPEVMFVLVDPNPFDCPESEKIRVIKGYFSTEMAKELKSEYSADNGKILFISDIRTADWKTQSGEVYLKYLNADNAAQAEWSIAVGAKKSMLKFSLPYGEGSTTYLDGDVFFPVWGPQTTTECRLVPSSGERCYDHKAHEEAMFYFNTATRESKFHCYEHVDGVGYDHRYDCSREIEILLAYVVAMDPTHDDAAAAELVGEMSRRISAECGRKGYTLATHPLNPFLEPRSAGNEDGQKRRRVEAVATRAVAHPCSTSLTEEGGGKATAEHTVLATNAVVMTDSGKVGEAKSAAD